MMRMATKILVLLLLSLLEAVANASHLTADTWSDAVAGKSVFVKFYAPWCGHCKKMQPAWEQLMESFQDVKGVVVAEVDCTSGGGKALCQQYGVRGYPTLKYGDPSSGELQQYTGQRDVEALKKFATEHLQPPCSPLNLDACSEEQKGQLQVLQALDLTQLEADLASKEAELQEAETKYTSQVKELTDSWEAFKKDSSAAIAMMKSVKAAASKSETKDEL